MTTAPEMHEPETIPIRFRPLFRATWGYEEFTRVAPFGPSSEGQAFGFTKRHGCRVEGQVLTGSLRMVQFPRWRSDGLYLPDARGLVETEDGHRVMVRATGFGIPSPDVKGTLTITHWMRFYTAAPDLLWLNRTVGFGVGAMVDDTARVDYFAADAGADPDPPPGVPTVELLGTARWEYSDDSTVRLSGGQESMGLAESAGLVTGGPLAGRWRGWHYPTHRRDGLHELDAHAEIATPGGIVINRHGGLAARRADMGAESAYHATQHALLTTEVPELSRLNRVLAAGVGVLRGTGSGAISYYGLAVRGEGAGGAQKA